jgi:hypothetical protein
MPLGALGAGLAEIERAGRTAQLLLFADVAAAQLNADTNLICADGGGGIGNCGRRWGVRMLLGSSAAYRLAVRKLLLQKLSGGPLLTATTATGPALLRSSRRIAASPKELDAGAAGDASALLAATAAAVGAQALRAGGGALGDAAALARGALLATRAGMQAGDASRIYSDIAAALLDMLARALGSRLEGEPSPSTTVRDLSLAAVRVSPTAATAPANSSGAQDADALPAFRGGGAGEASGLAMVRIGAALIPSAGSMEGTLEASGIGFRLLFAGLPANARPPGAACPKLSPMCVDFALSIGSSSGNATAEAAEAVRAGGYVAVCEKWDDSRARWNGAACAAPAALVLVVGRAIVSCSCTGDGIFRAIVRRPPPLSPILSAPDASLQIMPSVISLNSVALVIAITCVVAMCAAARIARTLITIMRMPLALPETLASRPVALKAELVWEVPNGLGKEQQLPRDDVFNKKGSQMPGQAGMEAAMSAGLDWAGSGFAGSFLAELLLPPVSQNAALEPEGYTPSGCKSLVGSEGQAPGSLWSDFCEPNSSFEIQSQLFSVNQFPFFRLSTPLPLPLRYENKDLEDSGVERGLAAGLLHSEQPFSDDSATLMVHPVRAVSESTTSAPLSFLHAPPFPIAQGIEVVPVSEATTYKLTSLESSWNLAWPV